MRAKTPDLPLGLSLGKEGEELFELLAAALGAGEGFELYFVCSENRHVLNEVQRRIESNPISGVIPRILDYHEAHDLRQLLPDLLSEGHPGHGRYAIGVKADGTEDELAAAWTNALVVLNEQRNRLIVGCPSAIVLLGSPRLVQIAQRQAPDLWSVRSSVFMLPDLPASQREHFSYTDLYSLRRETDSTNGERDGQYYTELAEALEGSPGKAEQLSRANLLMRAANAWVRRGGFELALARAAEAEHIYSELERPAEVFNALYAQAEIFNHISEYNRAMDLAVNRLLPISEKLSDSNLRAQSFKVLAIALDAKGTPNEALRLWRDEVLPVYMELGDRLSEVVALREIAVILSKIGRFDDAKNTLSRASALVQELGVRDNAAAIEIAQANVCFAMGEFKQARKLYDNALEVLRESGNFYGVASARLGIIALDIEEGDLSGARKNIDEVLRAFEKIGDKQLKARVLGIVDRLDLKEVPPGALPQ